MFVLSVLSVQSVLSDLSVRQLCRLNICNYIGWIDKYSVFVNSANITTSIETAVLSQIGDSPAFYDVNQLKFITCMTYSPSQSL